jgi:ubiquinone/menaquinone biosynthesis C-methylase UbiE
MDELQRILDAYDRRDARPRSGFFGYEHLAHMIRIQERHRRTLQMLNKFGFADLSQLKILDVGCGNGDLLLNFLQWGAEPGHLAGIDLREKPVARVRRISPQVDVRCGNAGDLPWPSDHFDIVGQHTVFTSILDESLRRQVASEMTRVLRSGGAILWYDFKYNNPQNPDVRAVRASEIRSLFKPLEIHLQSITLAAPLQRKLPEEGLQISYPLLASLRPLRTHYLGLFLKP